MKSAKPQLYLLWGADIGEHVIALAWAPSPGAPLLAAAAVGGPITIFGLDGHVAGRLPGHSFGATALAWRPGTATLASAGQDGKVRLWDVARGVEVAALAAGAAWVERLAWSPDGAWLATAAGRKLRLWGPDGVLVREYPAHASTVADIAWLNPTRLPAVDPTGPMLVAAAYGGLTLWSPESAVEDATSGRHCAVSPLRVERLLVGPGAQPRWPLYRDGRSGRLGAFLDRGGRP